MTTRERHNAASPGQDHTDLILDGTKIGWHMERVEAWGRGERIAPITVDLALTRACNFSCIFCYAALQENKRETITEAVMERTLTDFVDIGVKGVSLVSDGESSISRAFEFTVLRGKELGLSMAVGTNGYTVDADVAGRLLPALDYLRVNFDAATPESYATIMGVKPAWYHTVVQNIRNMVAVKRRESLPVTLGMQMVLMPQYGEEIIPLAKLAIELGVDYLVIKHCSDDEQGSLGVDYGKYDELAPVLREAEAMSTPQTAIIPKWNKIIAGNKRSYARCYGAPFLLQISGSGLVAPCGMLFGDRYRKFHIGNIVDTSFKEIWQSERYWEVMDYLRSDKFDARRMCGVLCLQDMVNRSLDNHVKGIGPISKPRRPLPQHINFV